MSDTNVLASVLVEAGFNADNLLKKASEKNVKDQLRRNTEEAAKLGLCGVPSYRVLEMKGGEWAPAGGLVWGQDELGVVEDLIAGWREDAEADVANVSEVHREGNDRPASKL